jgi:hypothetical protein
MQAPVSDDAEKWKEIYQKPLMEVGHAKVQRR